MTTVSLQAPRNVGTRDLVRAWLGSATPEDLAGRVVLVDCADLLTPTPSFLDEMIKMLVLERSADTVRVTNASERTALYAKRSAANRQVSDRVHVTERAGRRRLLNRVS